MVQPEASELSVAELREVQVGVLAGFDQVCRHHGLTYYLTYGTLLGAVRHGGYIPWDDDIDVMMPRGDYDRLPAAFRISAPPNLSLGSPMTRADWPFPYAKIGDDRTELREPLEDPLPLGVNLDVFPVDAVPPSRLLREVQSRGLRLLGWAIELRYISDARGRCWHHPLAIAVGKPLLRRIPARTLVAAITRVARWGRVTGERVGVRVGSFDWSVPAAALGIPVAVSFEHLRPLAPADPDAVLSAMYGDYLTLPPESERISHHAFTATWRAAD